MPRFVLTLIGVMLVLLFLQPHGGDWHVVHLMMGFGAAWCLAASREL